MNENIKKAIKENFDVALESGTSLIGGLLTESLIGQVAPGVVTTYLSYKQKRSEKMMLKAIEDLKARVTTLEENLKSLSEEQILFIKEKALPFILDNVIDETQEEKITYIINGFDTIIEHKITDEDTMMTYYDILKGLRMLDINILISIYKIHEIPEGQEGKVIVFDKLPAEELRKVDISKAIRNRILEKLQQYNLIKIRKIIADLEGSSELIIEDHRLSISVLGDGLLKFFKMN